MNEKSSMKSQSLEISDGRRKRSQRSREAIINATLSIIEGGNFNPTAKDIAREAGVGIRSFFRHFEDMDALYLSVDGHLRRFYEGLFVLPSPDAPPDAPLEERLADLISIRIHAFERVQKLIAFTQAQLWRSSGLQENFNRNQKLLSSHFESHIPELTGLEQADYEAAQAAASFDIWYRLRHHQNQSISATHQAIYAILSNLFEI